jgi:hypothetical protein
MTSPFRSFLPRLLLASIGFILCVAPATAADAPTPAVVVYQCGAPPAVSKVPLGVPSAVGAACLTECRRIATAASRIDPGRRQPTLTRCMQLSRVEISSRLLGAPCAAGQVEADNGFCGRLLPEAG